MKVMKKIFIPVHITSKMITSYGTGDYQDYLCEADQARFNAWTETADHESRFYAGCGIDIVCKVV